MPLFVLWGFRRSRKSLFCRSRYEEFGRAMLISDVRADTQRGRAVLARKGSNSLSFFVAPSPSVRAVRWCSDQVTIWPLRPMLAKTRRRQLGQFARTRQLAEIAAPKSISGKAIDSGKVPQWLPGASRALFSVTPISRGTSLPGTKRNVIKE